MHESVRTIDRVFAAVDAAADEIVDFTSELIRIPTVSDWDRDQEPRLTDNPYSFPDPEGHVRRYAEDGIGLVAIEESYLADTTAAFRDMPAPLSAYRRTDGRCMADRQDQPVTGVAGFWGAGRMVDRTAPTGAPRRQASSRRAWPLTCVPIWRSLSRRVGLG